MTFAELKAIYETPFFDLISRSRAVYLEHWRGDEMQLCTLLSIKTGGCSEDCGYCAQSARYSTGVKAERLMSTEAILETARRARENGSTRFCMGAAWKGVRDGDPRFEQVLESIREVAKLGMEVCVTLGQLGDTEAQKLKEAGVTAYNHNIDTSPEHYPNIVTTHTFQDRINTIQSVQKAGMDVCCGGIIGLGESIDDRLKMLEVLTNFSPAPESVPINCLMPMPGTPLENQAPVEKAKVRLSAGRTRLTKEGQALCIFAGANSIFYGDKLLTAKNPGVNDDQALMDELGLVAQSPRASVEQGCEMACLT
jgi:biotin synthase